MDKSKLSKALGTIWVRIYRATQKPITTGEVTDLTAALQILSEEADDTDVFGRQLLQFCEEVNLSNVIDARREPATSVEHLLLTCEALQRQLTK